MDNHPYLLIGAGGTGTHLLRPLLAYLDSWHTNQGTQWDLTVVDGDNYESGNLQRQMFEPEYVGINKATAVAEMYRQYPIRPIPRFIGIADLPDLMEEGTTVFIAADNFSIRALIEQHAQEMQNVTVINGGNERHDGSVQLWVRENGRNLTPRLSYLQPEIQYLGTDDRAGMSCMQVAQLPGGEQLIIANMTAAQYMLTALWRYHSDVWREGGWTKLEFDALSGVVNHLDYRTHRNWELDAPKIEIGALVPETT